jgi:HSP20 family protein
MAGGLIRRKEREGLSPYRRDPFFAPFYEFFDDFFNHSMLDRLPAPGSGGWAPALDLVDHPNEVLVKADLPGLSKEDIEISVSGDLLTLSGTRKESWESDKGLRSERVYGSFTRTLTLPAEVDGARAKASLANGVLELTLPKLEEAKQHRVKIEVK